MPRKTKLKTVTILNVPDFKDEDGLWFKSCSTVHEGIIYQYRTRAWCLWSGVKNRTEDAAHIIAKRPTYLGSKNLFDDFQFLAEWCQTQHGYMNKNPNGTFWHLDKDLIMSGNKDYAPDLCMFVPNHINNLFQKGHAKQAQDTPLPMGVTMNVSKTLFVAQGSSSYRSSRYLGSFETKEEAHRAWQEFKIGEVLYHSNREDISEKLSSVLVHHAEMLRDDHANHRETFSL